MIYYNLNQNLTIQNIAKDLNKVFKQIPQDELKQSILKISLVKITDYAGDSLLPKIEYKDQDSLT